MFRQHLKPALGRPNLTVLTGTRATRVHFEASVAGPRAVGVEFSADGTPSGRRLAAQLAPGGEVLLAGGAVHTPQLLQLSGLGPAATLAEHGIDAVSAANAVTLCMGRSFFANAGQADWQSGQCL